jgi:hypothetical protein
MKVKNEGVHCKNMMGVAWNNQLKFHLNIIHFFKKVHMLSILLHGIFMKDDVKFKVRNGTPKTLILSYVEVWWQFQRWSCNAFLKLDKNTYRMEFDFKMFISRWYNWKNDLWYECHL